MATTVNLVLGNGSAYTPPSATFVRLVLGGGAEATPGTLVCGLATRAPWGASAYPAGTSVGAPWGRVVGVLQVGARAPWGAAAAAYGSATVLPWLQVYAAPMHAPAISMPWGAASAAYGGAVRAPWGSPPVRNVIARAPWGAGRARHAAAALPWGAAATTGPGAIRAPWQAAGAVYASAALRWVQAGHLYRIARAPWGAGLLVIAPNVPYVVSPSAAPPSASKNWVRLRLCPQPIDPLRLVLGRTCATVPGGTTVIPARSSYMLSHTLTALRLPDLTPVPLTQFDLSADDSAFGWTLTAQGPLEVLTLLAPSGGLPRRLRVTIDSMVWEFVVEGLRRNRSFGQATGQITARSASALLAEPYAPVDYHTNSVPLTAQQIVNDALQFTGVGLDWRATDWLVPTGAWSATATPMGVVRAVADSIGALVQSPRAGDNVIIAPRYPTLPWNWAATTPDVILASLDAVVTEGYERADRPAYEGVYVSGQAQGVLALVKRTGTAPNVLMPMVTDALATHLDAARQRGSSMLGAQGPQARMTLTLPVLTGSGEPGVIDPGSLVRVDDPDGAWFGMVRSTRVSAVQPDIEQTITLERHL